MARPPRRSVVNIRDSVDGAGPGVAIRYARAEALAPVGRDGAPPGGRDPEHALGREGGEVRAACQNRC